MESLLNRDFVTGLEKFAFSLGKKGLIILKSSGLDDFLQENHLKLVPYINATYENYRRSNLDMECLYHNVISTSFFSFLEKNPGTKELVITLMENALPLIEKK